MKTSPRIQMGPMGGGMSIPMNPDRQRVFPIWETCSSIGLVVSEIVIIMVRVPVTFIT